MGLWFCRIHFFLIFNLSTSIYILHNNCCFSDKSQKSRTSILLLQLPSPQHLPLQTWGMRISTQPYPSREEFLECFNFHERIWLKIFPVKYRPKLSPVFFDSQIIINHISYSSVFVTPLIYFSCGTSMSTNKTRLIILYKTRWATISNNTNQTAYTLDYFLTTNPDIYIFVLSYWYV